MMQSVEELIGNKLRGWLEVCMRQRGRIGIGMPMIDELPQHVRSSAINKSHGCKDECSNG